MESHPQGRLGGGAWTVCSVSAASNSLPPGPPGAPYSSVPPPRTGTDEEGGVNPIDGGVASVGLTIPPQRIGWPSLPTADDVGISRLECERLRASVTGWLGLLDQRSQVAGSWSRAGPLIGGCPISARRRTIWLSNQSAEFHDGIQLPAIPVDDLVEGAPVVLLDRGESSIRRMT